MFRQLWLSVADPLISIIGVVGVVAVAGTDPGWLRPFMVVLPPLKVKPTNIGLIVQTGPHPEMEKLMVCGPGGLRLVSSIA